VLNLTTGERYMMVSKWLGHANFTITLNVYGDYIHEDEGGKVASLAAPATPIPSSRKPAPVPLNVIPLQHRNAA
jgi:hypothetical protein